MLGDLIRKYNLFAPERPIQPESSFRLVPPKSMEDFSAPYLDRLVQHIQAFPRRTEPNWLQRIGAILAGMSAGYREGPIQGLEAYRSYAELPYKRALEDWSTKLSPLYQAAQLESQNLGHDARYQSALAKAIADLNSRLYAADQTLRGRMYTADQQLAGTQARTAGQIESAKIGAEAEKYGADQRLKGMREIAGSRVRSAEIGASADRYRADKMVDAAKVRQPIDRANAAFENVRDQQALRALASKYPDIIKLQPNGKYVAVAPTSGLFPTGTSSEKYNQRYRELLADLEKMKSNLKAEDFVDFEVGSDLYRIPTSEVEEFLRYYPNARRIK